MFIKALVVPWKIIDEKAEIFIEIGFLLEEEKIDFPFWEKFSRNELIKPGVNEWCRDDNEASFCTQIRAKSILWVNTKMFGK